MDISRCHCQWTPPDCLRMTGALLEEAYLAPETICLKVSEGLLGCQGDSLERLGSGRTCWLPVEIVGSPLLLLSLKGPGL